MKRLALLMTGGAIWLFLAALPALADGGPHVSTINNGSLGINADSCAGCHRAHTASGPFLINAADEEALCLTCHGASGTGSTVDVMTGVQYTLGTGSEVRGTTVLGALRNGGFDLARIDSSNVARESYLRNATAVSQRPKVPVLAAGEAVTSAHLAMTENGLTNPGIAWGNGAFGDASPGPAVTISCASCHNPHGNGQYRILNPVPHADGTGFVEAGADALVTDAPLPPPGDTRNYTVIQNPLVDNDTQTGRTLLASQVTGAGYGPTDGDYFRRNVPWSPTVVDADCDPSLPPTSQPAGCTVATNNDAPNGLDTFNVQITAWCSQCHSRYLADGNTPPGVNPPYGVSSGDPTYTYRHPTRSNRTCNVCHVAHGSNATMDGVYSSNFEYPDGTTFSASSRLLKVDNRGTCQSCHDPTETIPAGFYVGPAPTPGAP